MDYLTIFLWFVTVPKTTKITKKKIIQLLLFYISREKKKETVNRKKIRDPEGGTRRPQGRRAAGTPKAVLIGTTPCLYFFLAEFSTRKRNEQFPDRANRLQVTAITALGARDLGSA